MDSPQGNDAFYKVMHALLYTSPNTGECHQDTQWLVSFLGEISEIRADFDLNEWSHISTEHGLAISPVSAAKCLQETKRTQVFLQAVKEAIEDRIAKGRSVRVLYAGTGPYGTLVLPLLAFLPSLNVRVTLIDIHPENIKAIQRMIRYFDLADKIDSIHLADATKWAPENSESFDIIVSETMNVLLKSEPQVWILANLVPYLSSSGALIPECISLGAHFTIGCPDYSTLLTIGEFFRLDKAHALDINRNDNSRFSGNIVVPEAITPKHKLCLTTDIQAYKNHRLSLNDSNLNTPIVLPIRTDQLEPNQLIHFEYHKENQVGFVFHFPKPEKPLCAESIANFAERSPCGLYQLTRAYQRCRLMRFGQKFEVSELDSQRDELLINALNLSYHQWLEILFRSDSINEVESHLHLLTDTLNDPDGVAKLNLALCELDNRIQH
ncbi:class I SAM-dependent methyltransferase (plasmid) [Pseudoalteromonas xiamenensis]|uniref:class I SAM-dependent methyltransferase n=1 Tax=Pseudoalteromonas xiamenensis TaxID=882626 RepID=UPI0027E42E88|nr:class I SAM-dependent methyltransferase [Pseudoalteromonas xiamenensis]WMN61680.1 class I SAM-dependent methyltransferase [Pseudoalteromonas xiamenensis]